MNISYLLQYSMFIKYCEYDNLNENLKHYLYNDYMNNLCLTSPIKKNCIFCDIMYNNTDLLYDITYNDCYNLYKKKDTSCSLDKWIKFCYIKFNIIFIINFTCMICILLYIIYFCNNSE